MKKKVFIAAMVLCFIVVALVTEEIKPGYDFPLDNGLNKLAAAFLALATALWGAMAKLKFSVFIWLIVALVMILSFGMGAFCAFLTTCVIARMWVQGDEEVKKMLEIPFKPEE